MPSIDHPGINRTVVRLGTIRRRDAATPKVTAENAIATPMMVTQWAPARPILRPNKPAIMRAKQRRKHDPKIDVLHRLTLEHIEVGDVDGTPVTEQHDQR
jgi:hypothetical protein